MIQKILSIAHSQIGVTEYPAGSNDVLYNTAYYGGHVSGSRFPWCVVFVWWVFKTAGLQKLFFGGEKTAYAPALLGYHSSQKVNGDYHPGDIIFFNFSGGKVPEHVGICESWNGRTITTIDGNTGTTSEANGGAVMRRVRDKKYICAAIRPEYSDNLTADDVRDIIADVEQEKREQTPSEKWGSEARAWAIQNGLFSGNEAGEMMWEAPVTRNQLATILYKLRGGV